MARSPEVHEETPSEAQCCNKDVKTRLLYVITVCLVLGLVYAVPDTAIKGDSPREDMLVTLFVLVSFTLVSFTMVQGSDPGYINVPERQRTEHDEAELLGDDEDGQHLHSTGEVEMVAPDRHDGVEEHKAFVRTPRYPDKKGASIVPQDRMQNGVGGGQGQRREVGTLASVEVEAVHDDDLREMEGQEDGDNDDDTPIGRYRDYRRVATRAGTDVHRKQGYCARCGFTPPLRSHHCRECNRCVATFDHHCLCISTCIGEKNHCRFWWFLLCQNLSLWSALRIVNTGFRPSTSWTDWGLLNALPLSTSMLLWEIPMKKPNGWLSFFVQAMGAFAFILLVAHTFFALGNMTTYEASKGPERLWYLRGTRDCDLPFSKGAIANLQSFCCFRDGFFWWLLGRSWMPYKWNRPGRIVRDSTDVCAYPWQNRYYSCC